MHAHTFHGMVENLYREARLDRPRRGDSSQSISIRKQVRTEYQFRFIDEETYWNPNSINPSLRDPDPVLLLNPFVPMPLENLFGSRSMGNI